MMTNAQNGKQGKKKNVRGHNPFLIISLIVIGVIILFFAATKFMTPTVEQGSSESHKSSGNLNSQVDRNCRDEQVAYNDSEQYAKTEYYTESVPYTDNECINTNLIYSITNAHWSPYACNHVSTQCNDPHWWGCGNSTSFCTDQTLTFSVDVNNLDDNPGTWTINIKFFRPDGSLYKAIPLTQSLYPRSTQTYTATTEITSDSPSGDANKAYTANYQETLIPTKQICHDVTKYKNVQRERQVTDYRPVTKYKTERVCN